MYWTFLLHSSGYKYSVETARCIKELRLDFWINCRFECCLRRGYQCVLFIATHHQITTETAGCTVIPTAMYVKAMKARQQDEEFRAKLINLNNDQWYQQPTRCSEICFIDSFQLALHVSGDSFAHLLEHFVCTAFWNKVTTLLFAADRSAADGRVGTLFQKAVYTKCSRRWAKLSPKTCRASWKQSIKQILLHLVGCWYHCTSDARSIKRQVNKSDFRLTQNSRPTSILHCHYNNNYYYYY